MCTTVPIPAYADFTKPFKLHTDACRSCLGVVLYQTHNDGMDAITSYSGRTLTKAETHYPAHKLEFLTLKWAVVEKFHKYLYGLTFDIHTNNNSLTYILTKAKLHTMSHHWAVNLANYNVQLFYRVGKAIINADAISRVTWPIAMPSTSGACHWIIAVVVQAMQKPPSRAP